MPATRSGGAAQGAPKIAPTVPIIVRKRCLHARHVASRCTRCIDVCGAGTLRLVEQQLIIDSRRCSSCGACVAACPTEALYAVVPETHALAQEIAAQARNGAVRISCTMAQLPPSEADIRVPCLARLSPGMLIDAVESGADCLQLTCGACATCSRRPKTDVVEEALQRVRAWLAARGRRVLDAPPHPGGSDEAAGAVVLHLTRHAHGMNSARRAAFGRLLGIGASALDREPFRLPADFRDKLEAIRAEPLVRIPEPQKARLRRFQKGTPETREAFALDAPVIDAEACACCGLCADMCPSRALKMLSQNPCRIIASPLLCCGCRLCADLCFKDAVTLERASTPEEAAARVVLEKSVGDDPMAVWEDKLGRLLGDVPIYRS